MSLVKIELDGIPEGLPDAPAMPKTTFKLEVLDNDDQVSKSIREQGIWEAFETRLLLDIITGGKFVDIGCHLGWFSVIAALNGCEYIDAYDESEKHLELARKNAKLNYATFHTIKMRIDESSPVLPAEDVEMLKCDIEGNERWAFRMYENSFREKRIKYAFMEISPCFNDSYPTLVEEIEGCGYKAYQIPGKLYVYRVDYAKDPLKTMIENPVPIDWKTLRQENFLFVRLP